MSSKVEVILEQDKQSPKKVKPLIKISIIPKKYH